jgi:hypothetical protein
MASLSTKVYDFVVWTEVCHLGERLKGYPNRQSPALLGQFEIRLDRLSLANTRALFCLFVSAEKVLKH